MDAEKANSLHDAGLLNVADFLYVLRNDAGRAADELGSAISEMEARLEDARVVWRRLDSLAGSAEKAAERESRHD